MKQETFSYENPQNKMGKFQIVPIEQLVIPAEDEVGIKLKDEFLFQRKEVNSLKTKRRAENWDWLLCGVITVVYFKDMMVVVDGGNRVRSARLNGTIKKMPCMVFPEMSLTDIARAFLGIQELRTSVKSREKHNTSIKAKNPMALIADQIINANGYTTSNNKKEFCFDAIHAFYSVLKVDESCARRAFEICADICSGERIFKEFLFGVFELERRCLLQKNHTAFTDANIDKLAKAGIRTIVGEVNSVRALCGKSGGSQSRTIPARALLNIINKSKGKGRLIVSLD